MSRQRTEKQKEDNRLWSRKYRIEHKDRVAATAKRSRKKHKDQRRLERKLYGRNKRIEILSHYSMGKPKCKRCGNDDIRVLSIDHINGGGCKHQQEIKSKNGQHKKTTLQQWILNNNFPEIFQILCMNCQYIKRWEHNEHPYQQLTSLTASGGEK
jgi:hypothetical protein